MDTLQTVIAGLQQCVIKTGHCDKCPYFPRPGCEKQLLADTLALLPGQAVRETEAEAEPPAPCKPRPLRPEEYDTWDADAWCENCETGEVTAVDRSAVPAFVRYIRFDTDTQRRLWTARPTEEQRRETSWPK